MTVIGVGEGNASRAAAVIFQFENWRQRSMTQQDASLSSRVYKEFTVEEKTNNGSSKNCGIQEVNY